MLTRDSGNSVSNQIDGNMEPGMVRCRCSGYRITAIALGRILLGGLPSA